MGSKNNSRRSQWRVMIRCLGVLRCLMRGPTKNSDLLEIIHEDARLDEEELTHSVARKRFEEDRARLKTWLEVELEYDRTNDEYALLDIGHPLINLTDNAVRGLTFLDRTFSGDDAPMREDVRAFLEQVKMLLPAKRRKEIEKQRGLLELELGVQDSDEIDEHVWGAIHRSVAERRQLEIDYLSPSNESGIPRRHTVEPIRHFFDTTRKHYYLEAFWLQTRSQAGTFSYERKVQRFRLGRMSNATVLPTHFPANRRIPQKELVYELTPTVARLGVTEHFAGMQIIENDDGSVRVHALSSSLFFDLRKLLHYGENCRVIGGDEAVREMKKLVSQLTSVYADK